MPDCPTCSDSFDSERGMKIHHTRSHGESIAFTEIECESCGDTFTRRDSNVTKNTKYCSYSCKFSEENSGEGHWHWEGGSDEAECEWCGDEFDRLQSSEQRFCSYDCMGEWRSETFSGEEHWNWKEDQTDYYGEDWYSMRDAVRRRDVVCQRCGADGSDCLLDVHHIVPRREFDDVNDSNTMGNLILLCRSCHHKVEKGGAECPEP